MLNFNEQIFLNFNVQSFLNFNVHSYSLSCQYATYEHEVENDDRSKDMEKIDVNKTMQAYFKHMVSVLSFRPNIVS